MFSLSSHKMGLCLPASAGFSSTDSSGIRHSAEVAAESLYEAATLTRKAFRAASLIDDLAPDRATILTAAVKSPATEHAVSVSRVHEWLASHGRSPKEQITKVRLKQMLEK